MPRVLLLLLTSELPAGSRWDLLPSACPDCLPCANAAQEPTEPLASRIAFANVAADKRADQGHHSSDSSDDGGAKSGNESGAEDDPDQAHTHPLAHVMRKHAISVTRAVIPHDVQWPEHTALSTQPISDCFEEQSDAALHTLIGTDRTMVYCLLVTGPGGGPAVHQAAGSQAGREAEGRGRQEGRAAQAHPPARQRRGLHQRAVAARMTGISTGCMIAACDRAAQLFGEPHGPGVLRRLRIQSLTVLGI
jgi:hypothetical protein